MLYEVGCYLLKQFAVCYLSLVLPCVPPLKKRAGLKDLCMDLNSSEGSPYILFIREVYWAVIGRLFVPLLSESVDCWSSGISSKLLSSIGFFYSKSGDSSRGEIASCPKATILMFLLRVNRFISPSADLLVACQFRNLDALFIILSLLLRFVAC